MKFNAKDLEHAIDQKVGQTYEGITLVEKGEWEVDRKVQLIEYIISHGDKFYSVDDQRWGNYHEGYEYESSDWPEEVECTEVKKVEVVKHEWHQVE